MWFIIPFGFGPRNSPARFLISSTRRASYGLPNVKALMTSPAVSVDSVPTVVRPSRSGIIALSVVSFLYWVSMYLYVPTLPTFIKTRSDNLALVGTILAMYGLWQALVRLPLGIFADWVGQRKPFIVAGLVLSALGAWLLGQGQGAFVLLIGRSISGIAASSWVLMVVLFSAQFPPGEAVRGSSLAILIATISRLVATGVNGSLNDLGGYPLAFNLAALAALMAVPLVLFRPEVRKPAPRRSWSSIGALVTRGDVLIPALLNAAIQYAVYATTFGFFPILAQQMGANGVMQSLMVSFQQATVIAGNLLSTLFAGKIGTRFMVIATLLAVFAGPMIAAVAPSLFWVFVATACMGLCYGVGYPVFMGLSIQLVPETERATAMGLHQAVYAIGMFTGPWLSGVLADAFGLQPMFGITAFLCLGMVAALARPIMARKTRVSS
jgi:MFS family permease